MKRLFIALIILAIVFAIKTAAETKAKCSICEKEIKNGQYIVYLKTEGGLIDVHFQHAFDVAWKERPKK
jgi:hypothetical protein